MTPWLELRRRASDHWEWYRLHTAEGTAAGRYAVSSLGDRPPLTAYDHHVTGWNAEAFALSGAALSWDVAFGDGQHARVRIAKDGAGVWSGRFKVYAGPSVPVALGQEQHLDATAEQLEEDLDVVRFDGSRLTLSHADVASSATLVRLDAIATGRTLAGTATLVGGATLSVDGRRSALSSFGFVPRADRGAWQATTRRRVENLLMNGNPPPAGPCTVVLGASAPPFAPSIACLSSSTCAPDFVCDGGACMPARRDDDQAHHPQSYTLNELTISCPMTNPFNGSAIAAPRLIHGWVATPNAPAPANGYPAVLALNGHGGTARAVMTPDEPLGIFYYGDAYARRGFLVVAIDIKHHPDEPIGGEDGSHSAIIGDGYAGSDWEEDGERVWDLMRATDWIQSRTDVDRARMIVTGLSMGGEETTLLAALDPRFAMAIPAGYSPDMDVLLAVSGHNCWQWRLSSIHEYLDQADLHALIAPRALLVETGKQDLIFSDRSPPFSGDLQVMRRSRAAWSAAEGTRLQLYLHYDVHAYHFGDLRAGDATGLGVGIASPVTGSTVSKAWQTDTTTTTLAPTVFDVITADLP